MPWAQYFRFCSLQNLWRDVWAIGWHYSHLLSRHFHLNMIDFTVESIKIYFNLEDKHFCATLRPLKPLTSNTSVYAIKSSRGRSSYLNHDFGVCLIVGAPSGSMQATHKHRNCYQGGCNKVAADHSFCRSFLAKLRCAKKCGSASFGDKFHFYCLQCRLKLTYSQNYMYLYIGQCRETL